MADSGSQDTIQFALYRYVPSIPAGAIFAVVFGLLAIFHAFRLIRHQTLFFIPFVIGLLREYSKFLTNNK